MTMGQRIARKRKELGLSQEGLGERLGVSRQAIYKWESDAALPEIEKLVNLSREFGVSVGWLLGEEDESAEKPELTPEQLRMVEEIVGRYLDARPRAEPPGGDGPSEGGEPERPKKRRRWPLVLAAAVLIGVFFNLFSRLDQMRQENQSLQMAVANIRSDVNSEIYSITQRVEEVLQSQNSLTAEQSAQVAETDCRANTVTVEVRAVPRTYVEGMTAEFTVVSGGEPFTAAGELGENHAFTASVTVPLTDEITVSAAFLNGDQRQTQVLEQFDGLYSRSFPDITVSSGGSRGTKAQGAPAWTVTMGPVDVHCIDAYGEPAKLASLRVGLFRDGKLMEWLTQEDRDDDIGWRVFRLEEETVEMEIGHTYCIAAVVVDEFGREWVVADHYGETATESSLETGYTEYSREPADWEY